MEFFNQNDILNDPLAGCLLDQFGDEGYLSLRDSLYLRLRMLTSKEHAGKVLGWIDMESDHVLPGKYVYVINELQYECRHASRAVLPTYTPAFESEVLNLWASALADQFPLDEVLAFVSKLKQFRLDRSGM